ncbi:MAG: PAS domain S-box protein [Pseudohongiellaceae bacterium]
MKKQVQPAGTRLSVDNEPYDQLDADCVWQLVVLSNDYYWREDAEGCCVEVRSFIEDDESFCRLLLGNRLNEALATVADDGAAEILSGRRERLESFREFTLRVAVQDHVLYLCASGEPQFDAAGAFEGYICVATDITRQKENESRLKRFRAAMDMSVDMIYLVDRETLRFIDVNDTACINAGLSREEYLAMGPLEVLNVDREELIARYDKLISEGGVSLLESSVTSVQGKTGFIEVVSRATRIDGRWIIIGMSHNITARKNAEIKTLRLQQMFSALSDTNAAILKADTVPDLFQKVCDAAVSGGKFNVTSILQPNEQGILQTVASAGLYALPSREQVLVSVRDGANDRHGVSGEAWRKKKLCVSNDILADKRATQWHDLLRSANVASVAALPLFERSERVASNTAFLRE